MREGRIQVGTIGDWEPLLAVGPFELLQGRAGLKLVCSSLARVPESIEQCIRETNGNAYLLWVGLPRAALEDLGRCAELLQALDGLPIACTLPAEPTDAFLRLLSEHDAALVTSGFEPLHVTAPHACLTTDTLVPSDFARWVDRLVHVARRGVDVYAFIKGETSALQRLSSLDAPSVVHSAGLEGSEARMFD